MAQIIEMRRECRDSLRPSEQVTRDELHEAVLKLERRIDAVGHRLELKVAEAKLDALKLFINSLAAVSLVATLGLYFK